LHWISFSTGRGGLRGGCFLDPYPTNGTAVSRKVFDPLQPISRRKLLLTTTAGIAAPLIVRAEPALELKFAHSMPVAHPLNARMAEARSSIHEKTGGGVAIHLLPVSDLGTGANMIRLLRSGQVDLAAQSALAMSTLIPSASSTGIGFAFSDYSQVWKATDGALGKFIIEEFAAQDLTAFERMWDNGFRQITSYSRPIASAHDLRGLSVRVPGAPLWTSLFKALGTALALIPWDQTHSALHSKTVDGCESALAGIYFTKIYEVQRYLSRTNHMWDGFWVFADRRRFESWPAHLRDIIIEEINLAALRQRDDTKKLDEELETALRLKGLEIFKPDFSHFRRSLTDSDFYLEWRARLGSAAWTLLEQSSGKLV
jgi:TRAP-type transport system periplasmic protein